MNTDKYCQVVTLGYQYCQLVDINKKVIRVLTGYLLMFLSVFDDV